MRKAISVNARVLSVLCARLVVLAVFAQVAAALPYAATVTPIRVQNPDRVTVSGTTLLVSSTLASKTQLEFFDISDPCRPVPLAFMDNLPKGRVGFGNGVVLIAPSGDTITVVNAMNPSAPYIAYTFDLHAHLGWHPLDTIEFYDIRVRGSHAFLIATGGDDSHGDFGDLHVLTIGPSGLTPIGLTGIGSPARFQDLFLIGDMAVCTRTPPTHLQNRFLEQQNTVYFDIGNPSTPGFFAWALTWGCGVYGVPDAFGARSPIHVPIGTALHRIELSHELCGTSTGHVVRSDGVHHTEGATYFATDRHVWQTTGDAATMVSDIPVGDWAIEVVGGVFYTVDANSLYALSEACYRPLFWNEPNGGAFENPSHWDPRSAPRPESTIIFDLPAAYAVAVHQDGEVARAEVKAGEVQLNLRGHTLSIDQLDCTGGTLGVATSATSGVLSVRVAQFTDTAELAVMVGGAFGSPMIDVSGTADISGTLRIWRTSGYVARVGDYVPLLRASEFEMATPGGFLSVEGILDTGDPSLFWGLDCSGQDDDGTPVIALVALRVPEVVTPLGGRRPYRVSNARNLVLISHGTADAINPGDELDRIASGLAALADRHRIDNEFDVVVLNWKEFATNKLERTAGSVLPFGLAFFAHVLTEQSDSRNRAFDPYETARFGREYARSVLAYLAAEGAAGGSGGVLKRRIDVGAMRSLHTIGHSSGSYTADAFHSILLDAKESPFGGSAPAIRHLTLLDAYLPPQYGGMCVLPRMWCWTGPALGTLGRSTTSAEHYFMREGALGTDNEVGYRASANIINFDVTGYLLWAQPLIGHAVPISFYLDSITAQLDRSQFVLTPAQHVDPYVVFDRYGVVFSPLMIRAGFGRDVHSALAFSRPDEYSDGDIDVVYTTERSLVSWVYGIDPNRVNFYGTDGSFLEDGGLRLRTRSPAITTVSEWIPSTVNAVEVDVRLQQSAAGTLMIMVEDRVLAEIPIEALQPTGSVQTLGPLGFEAMGPGNVAVTIHVESAGGEQIVIDVVQIRAVAVLMSAEPNYVAQSRGISGVATDDGGLVASFVDADQSVRVVRLNPSDETWHEWVIDAGGQWSETPLDTVSFVDAFAETTTVAVLSKQATLLFDLNQNQPARNLTEELADVGALPITSSGTAFMSIDGITFIGGLSADGDLILYWQTGQFDAAQRPIWGFTNLDRDHLAPQGLSRPRWVGQIVSFVTAWNGLNIVGLDEIGQLWSVWWAPGLDRWRTHNLSVLTGAPPLLGGLAAYVTAWNAINIVGLDLRGQVQVIWWLPEFAGNWVTNDLSDLVGHAGFGQQGLASYVTPWGGTNVAGVDDSGHLVVYWWAPGMSDWVVSPLSALIPNAVLPLRAIDGVASPDGLISLFGFSDGTTPVRYFWRPNGQWQAEAIP